MHPDGASTTTDYNKLGQRTSFTDQLDRMTRYEYDLLGHHTAVELPAVDDPTDTTDQMVHPPRVDCAWFNSPGDRRR